MQMIYDVKRKNGDAKKIISPRRIMILVNVIIRICVVSCDNTYEYLDSDHPIVTNKTVKFFIRLIALIEMLMLVKVGIVGWNFDK